MDDFEFSPKRMLAFIVRLLAAGVIVFVLADVAFKPDLQLDKLNKEFPIVTDSTIIHHKVKEIFCPPKTRCAGAWAAFLILNDDSKLYLKIDFNDTTLSVLSPGDSISKVYLSNELLLYKAGEMNPYRFEIE